MNLQQQREEARRRRLVNRSVAQHRQLYFDDARRGVVSTVGNQRRSPLRLASAAGHNEPAIDSPAITRALKIGIVTMMAGLLTQHGAALLQAATTLLPFGLVG